MAAGVRGGGIRAVIAETSPPLYGILDTDGTNVHPVLPMMNRSLLPIVLSLLAVAACSDFSTAPTRVPVTFELTPDTVLLTEGETVTFEYTVVDEAGEAYDGVPGWASPLWTFSKDSIVRVDVMGVGEALAPGEASATAELAGLQQEALIRVNPTELRVQPGFVHVTQSTQRRRGGVPLVAGRDGLLRVLVVADKPNFFTPEVRATFYRSGSVVHTMTLGMEAVGLPESVEEGDLALTYDGRVPGSVLQPRTGVVIEVDPGGVVPTTSESTLRSPEVGVTPLDIVELRPFQVRLVPVRQSLTGQESSFSVDNAVERLEYTRDVFPIADMDVELRAPYTTDADLTTRAGWNQLLEEIWTLRQTDGSAAYYYGGFRVPLGTKYLGLGYVGGPASIGIDSRPGTIAHELGHNLGLPHAPCGNPDGVDPDYPYPGAFIGEHGYSLRMQQLREPDEYFDLMSYCDPAWISDYNYENVVAFRQTSPFEAEADGLGAAEDVLIVHAGVRDGVTFLSPAVRLTGRPSLPTGEGRYTLEGRDRDGALLFALRFEPRPLDHGDQAMFSAAIPATLAQPDRLASLRMTGPEGAAERRRGGGPPQVALENRAAPGVQAPTLRWDAGAYPLAVVRDRATGRIVAMSRTGRVPVQDPGSVDVVVSDGVRTHPVELSQR